MSNTYFKFKQFTVHQDRCALKVCTDACLFGAWVAEKVGSWHPIAIGLAVNAVKRDFNMLDIGAGTGLLSFMLSQKTTAHIDAVEIDKDAAQQATDNFSASPWKERLQVHFSDIKHFATEKKYGLIISNPPFFENDLKSHQHRKNLAKHEEELPLSLLLKICNSLLDEHGRIAVLIPWHRLERLKESSEAISLHISHVLEMRQTPSHSGFRAGVILQKQATSLQSETIIIKETAENYSDRFIELLKDYYLYL